MSITSVSNISQTQMLVSALQNQTSTLDSLSTELASQQKYDNLTDYSAGDALNLMNLQSSATQQQAYLANISITQTRLSTYDTTMTDMESIISQASTLADGSTNYDASTASNIAATAQSFLKSVGLDLNQQLNGRYIYAGSRYTTAPVVDLTTLGAPSATTTTDPIIPDYDTFYAPTQLTFTSVPSSSLTIGGSTTTPGSQNVSVVVGGTTYTYGALPTDTPATIAAGLSSVLNTAGISASASGATLTLASGTITSVSAGPTSADAYKLDSATIASGYSLQYGVTSDAPAFQQMIAGLQYLAAAGNSTNATTYAANMSQATTLLSSALTGVQTLHTGVANNINVLTAEMTQQNAQINNISNQIDDIQSVDVTQVSTEITALQAILEASYTVTGDLSKLSLSQYL